MSVNGRGFSGFDESCLGSVGSIPARGNEMLSFKRSDNETFSVLTLLNAGSATSFASL